MPARCTVLAGPRPMRRAGTLTDVHKGHSTCHVPDANVVKLNSNGDGELRADVLELNGRCDNQEHTGINCQSSGRVVLLLIAVSLRHPALTLLSVVSLRANTKLKSGGTTPSARPGANNETSSVGYSTWASHRVHHITRRAIVRQSRGFLSRRLSTPPCPSCFCRIPRPLYPPLIPPTSLAYRAQQAIPLTADGTLSILSKGTRVREVVRMRWESLA